MCLEQAVNRERRLRIACSRLRMLDMEEERAKKAKEEDQVAWCRETKNKVVNELFDYPYHK